MAVTWVATHLLFGHFDFWAEICGLLPGAGPRRKQTGWT